jgi:hypothetical protein
LLEWEELIECLNPIQLSGIVDTIKWCLTSNGKFSIASLYGHCSFSRVINTRMVEMWKARIPLKVKNFVWLCTKGGFRQLTILLRNSGRE